ncbi:MAG TPA: carboxypeptidase regulatory-like domain-containing protein [Mobilitalea sp.]|nr:carboxypeptidase regulatory-like domain-containing protein [Mobilitalea sp.]
MFYHKGSHYKMKLAVLLVLTLLVTSILPGLGNLAFASANPTLEKKYKYSYSGTGNNYKMLNVEAGYMIKWSISEEAKGYVSFSDTDRKLSEKTVKVTKDTSSVRVYTHTTARKKLGTSYQVKATIYDALENAIATCTDQVTISCDALRAAIMNEPKDRTMSVGGSYDFNCLLIPIKTTNQAFWIVTDAKEKVLVDTKKGITSDLVDMTSKGVFTPYIPGEYNIRVIACRSQNATVVRAKSEPVTIKVIPVPTATPTPVVSPTAVPVIAPVYVPPAATPTTAPETINLTVNGIMDGEAYKVSTETITITGTVDTNTNIKELKVKYHSNADATEKSIALAKASPFSISALPLDIGTNFVTITAVATNGTTVSKELLINRVSTVVNFADNVRAFDNTTELGLREIQAIYEGIENYWEDDMGTPEDTSDDQYNLVVKETNPLLSYIRDGIYRDGDIIYIPQCEYFPAGLSLIYRSHDDNYGSAFSYSSESYEVIHTQIPGYGDLFSENISLDTTEVNQADPIAFVLLPGDTDMYLADNEGGNQQLLLASSNATQLGTGNALQLFSADDYNTVSGSGFQLNNLSALLSPTFNFSDINNGSIVLDFDDAVLYDKDGDPQGNETQNDRVTVSGEISLKNIKPTFGLEWHPSLSDLLPQQFISKLSYTQNMNLNCTIGGEIGNLSSLLSDYKEKTNAFVNKRSFVGIDFEGVDMENTMILGAIGINLAGVQGANINTIQAASIFAPFNPIVVVLICMNADGQLSTQLVFDYQTTIYREQGINIQKEGFVGAYGSSAQNRGTTNFTVNDRNVNIYNITAKSRSERNVLPESSLTISANGSAEASMGFGGAVGIMMAGIIPAAVKADIGPRAKATLNGSFTINSSGATNVEGDASLNLKLSLKAAANVNLTAKNAFQNVGITFTKDLGEYTFLEYNMSSITFKGKVFASDSDRDLTNNPVLSEAKVTLTKVNSTSLSNTDYFEKMTGSDGSFSISNVAAGNYILEVSKDGYVTYRDEEFTIEDSGNDRNIYLDAANQTATLCGIVTKADEDTNASNNTPLQGIVIGLTKIGSTTTAARSVVTDANGYYSFADLPLGIYEITISDSNFIPITSEIIISTANTTNYNITLEAISNTYSGSGVASGYVYNALTGRGVEAGLTLTVLKGYNLSTGEVVTTTTTGEGGVYSLTLPAGNYTVYVNDLRTDAATKYRKGYFNIKVLGNITIGNQNGEVTPIMAEGEIRIILVWGEIPYDLDSHLTGPTSSGGTFHTYYRNKSYSESGKQLVQLDVDDTDSYGPETTTIYTQSNGVYKFTVHDYSNRGSTDSMALANSGACVKVYYGERVLTYYVPNLPGTAWDVFEYNSETGEFRVLGNMYYQSNPSAIGMQVTMRAAFMMEAPEDEYLKDYEREAAEENNLTGTNTTDGNTTDTNTTDGNNTDTDTTDANATDTNATDTNTTDAGTTDTDITDTDTTDANTTDTDTANESTTDTAGTTSPETGAADENTIDSNITDGNTVDSNIADTNSADGNTVDSNTADTNTAD